MEHVQSGTTRPLQEAGVFRYILKVSSSVPVALYCVLEGDASRCPSGTQVVGGLLPSLLHIVISIS